MVFTHDTQLSLSAAAELVNSAAERDTLTTPGQLGAFLQRYGYSGRHDGDDAELGAVLDIRAQLRALLLATGEPAVLLVNAVLAEHRAVPQLVRHDGLGWHIHPVPEDTDLATRILVETAMAMIDVIRTGETSRLSVCADDACEGVVVDLSRNRSRRYCSTACGNRNAVAAYRARRARGTSD